jgi:DNA-binding CsgD family transcriptional regulator
MLDRLLAPGADGDGDKPCSLPQGYGEAVGGYICSVIRSGGLVEREAELEELGSLLRSARDGRGGLAVIEGPPGIGKTGLLEALRDAATGEGLEVLAARGGDLERDLPFGVVRQLFELTLRKADAEHRALLLDGPAELAGSVLLDGDDVAGGSSSDRSYAVMHGLYWLTSNLAERSPLLLAVDDAHWADIPSLRFLYYLARRVEDLRLLMLVTLRPTEPEARAELAARMRAEPRATVLSPAPLSRTAVADLVRERLGREPAPEFCDACHVATQGNPFLLRELIAELRSDGIEPSTREAPTVSRLVPDAVARHVLARLLRLPADAQELARAVAVLGADVELRHAGQLAGLDEPAAGTAADALTRAQLLRVGPALEFVHPLIREATYADMAPGERTLAHERAARILDEAGAPASRVAAQLLHSATTDEPWAVEALRAAASDALARGGPESAVIYLRRAMRGPLDTGERADVIFELGAAEALIDGPAAAARLAEALDLAQEPERRAAIAAQLARHRFYEGSADDVLDICTSALSELGATDEDLRARLEAEVLLNAMFEPSHVGLAGELALRGMRAGEPEGLGAKALLASSAWVAALAGVPAAVVTPRAEQALRGGELMAEDNGGPTFICAALVLALAESELAIETCTAGLAAARASGNGYAFATNKTFTSRVRLFRGEVAQAVADGSEGLEASETYEIGIGPNYAGVFLADALMERGELDAATQALDRVAARGEVPASGHWHPFLDSRSRLLMLRGRTRDALEQTLECGRRYSALGATNPGWIAWRSRAAVCLTLLGEDPDRAGQLVDEELELARAFGAPRAIGRALRAKGLVADEPERLSEAVDVLEGSQGRLELAYALCDLGAALRRGGRRQDSRQPLRRAVELAHDCGATALEERAHQELLASGARPRRRPVTGVDALTPSELRVASMAAGGMSNREIAQDLFVSLKTVEMHLRRGYRKLDVSSRSQLPLALKGQG